MVSDMAISIIVTGYMILDYFKTGELFNMKKTLYVIGLTIIIGLSISIVSLADQTDRWHSDSNGTWYLYNEAKTSDVVNSWFQDLDGSWYLLAPGDGHMYAGLIHDTLTDKWYFCQTEHDGWYGRMAHTDGSYTVNGQSVYLTFNQQHDGTFGAITSGLDTLRGTGVQTQDVAGIPTDSASATEAPQQQTNTSSSSTSGSMSDAEFEAFLNSLGGSSGNPDGLGDLSGLDLRG